MTVKASVAEVAKLVIPSPAGDKRKAERPTHYKVVCHSMYTDDLNELDRKVTLLKQHGWSKANRSHLIRIALSRLTDAELETIANKQRGNR